MAYYYLISSLPMLRADGDMPLSYEQFLEMCRSAVSDSKYAVLEKLTLLSDEGPFLSQWAKYYGVLHAELTYQRNLRLGRKAQPPGQKDEGIAKLVTSAMNNPNPLAAEEQLLASQFKTLDELIGIHYFDDHALIGYALKLKLLERKKGFDQTRGKAEFSRMIGSLEQQIMSMEQE